MYRIGQWGLSAPLLSSDTSVSRSRSSRHVQAVQHLRPTATAVFVPPLAACGAILEAIEAEVPLIVSVAEGVPLKDQMKIMSALHSQSKSRLVGANSPGMANPRGCRLGISPPVTMAPGPVGE
jgi:succinyl-CoA synthetase alpha subunit